MVTAGIPFFYSSVRRMALPMWVVRECESCPICLRECSAFDVPGGTWIAVLSQVALELALTTRVRVIASFCDSRSSLLSFFDESLTESPFASPSHRPSPLMADAAARRMGTTPVC